MNKTKILLACPTSIHFVQEYIENVLDDKQFDIYFLTWRLNGDVSFFNKKNVNVITLLNESDSKIKKILKLPFKLLRLSFCLKSIDILHYHFIDHRFVHIVEFFIGRNAKKTILSFWGSDLLRQTKRKILSFNSLYKRANKINLMNKEMLDSFNKTTKSKFLDKLLVLDFGDSTLDSVVKNLKASGKKKAKEMFGVPENKITVHLAYNGFRAQQHLKMIESLSVCDESVKDQIFVMVPLSYGCDGDDYKKQISAALKDAGIEYAIYDSYLEKEDVANFRLSADIFLYGQVTDAVSASMIEYIAAGCAVVKPKWLVYSELTDVGVVMIEYESFSNLTSVFEYVIKNNVWKTINYGKNQSEVFSMKSWSVLKNKWLEMYND